jgi:hypothetical protein
MLTGYDRGEGIDRRAVLYYDGPLDALERRAEPAHDYDRFEIFYPCALEAETVWTLPPLEEIQDHEAFFPPVVPILTRLEDYKPYWKELRRRDFCHQLLGHPAEIQGGEMRLDVVEANDTEGYFAYEDYDYQHRDELIEEMRRWRLLAQFQSDQPTGMCWGDCGMIYYWIREEDLTARRFDRVYGELECT